MDCTTCDATVESPLAQHAVLSVRMPPVESASVPSAIRPGASAATCQCNTKCAVTVAENDYCESCGGGLKQSMLDDLADLPVGELQRVCLPAKSTTEELLIASLAIRGTQKKSA